MEPAPPTMVKKQTIRSAHMTRTVRSRWLPLVRNIVPWLHYPHKCFEKTFIGRTAPARTRLWRYKLTRTRATGELDIESCAWRRWALFSTLSWRLWALRLVWVIFCTLVRAAKSPDFKGLKSVRVLLAISRFSIQSDPSWLAQLPKMQIHLALLKRI